MYNEKIVNSETGKITIREYTAEEIAEVEQALEIARVRREELAKKDAARKAALNKLVELGLTEEEIAAL